MIDSQSGVRNRDTAALIRRLSSPFWSIFEICSKRTFGVISVSGKRIAAPALASSLAFFVWWSLVADGYGIKIDGTPAAAISETVIAPARHITASADVK